MADNMLDEISLSRARAEEKAVVIEQLSKYRHQEGIFP